MAGFMAVSLASLAFGTVGKAEGDTAWLLLAHSNYFYATPTITLEVKYKPLPAESTDKPEPEIITSDDKDVDEGQEDQEELAEEQTQTGQENSDNMAISSGDNDQRKEQHQGQQTGGDGTEAGDDNTGLLPHLGRNALIISRLTEKHSLRTEIEVDNITSNDSVFIDVFSGDLQLAAQSGDIETATADSVFISFENEEGTIETVRIGIDAEQGGIDNIVVLDGISEALPVGSKPASEDSQHHIDDASLGLEQIKSPIIIILPDTDERMYFIDGKKLKEQVFSKDYRIEGIKAVRDELEIRLVEK